ncbi:MAG: DMT family transporter, partial [Oscillospiraceae bacterium]
MSLSAAAILLYTAPAIVTLLSALLFKERLTGLKLLAVLLAFLGCALVSGLGAGDMALSTAGILYGLGAGFGYAMYSIFARFALERGYSSNTINFYSCLLAAVGAALIWGVDGVFETAAASGGNIALALGTGVVTCYLPYLLYTYGLTGLETDRASITAAR